MILKKKKIKIKYICDKCYYSSENENEFIKVGYFNLCLKCYEKFENFIQTFKGQTIENFIFEEK